MSNSTLFSIFAAVSIAAWLDIIKSMSAAATALVAYKALRNWQRQDKAKLQAEFLDQLIESAHTYINSMGRPIFLLESAKIGMESHVKSWENGDELEKRLSGAIIYIENIGKQQQKDLFSLLEIIEPSVVKLRSLSAKGQIFHFKNYEKCQNSIKMLTWNFDLIQAFAGMIGSTNRNWEHPEIRQTLVKIIAINPDDIRKNLKENSMALLEFSRSAYENIYG